MFLNAAISALNTVKLNGGEMSFLRELEEWILAFFSSFDSRSAAFGFLLGFICPLIDILADWYLRRHKKQSPDSVGEL